MPRVDERGITDLPEGLKSLSIALAFLLRYDAYKAGWLDDENWMPVGQAIEEIQRGGKGRHAVKSANEADLQTVVRTSFKQETPRFEMRIYGGQSFLRAADGEQYRQKAKKGGRKAQPNEEPRKGREKGRNPQRSGTNEECGHDRGDWSPRSNASDVSGVSGFSRVSQASYASKASYAPHTSHASLAPRGGKGQRKDHGSSYSSGQWDQASSSGAYPSTRGHSSKDSMAAAQANHPTYDYRGVKSAAHSAAQSAAQGSRKAASDLAGAFDGAWCHQDTPRQVFCQIDGRVLLWEGREWDKSYRQDLQIRKEGIALLSKDGRTECVGRLVSGKLLWDDGDVWLRAMTPAGDGREEKAEASISRSESSAAPAPAVAARVHPSNAAAPAGRPSALANANGPPHADTCTEDVADVEAVPSSPSTFDMRGADANDDSVDDPDWDEMRAILDFDGSKFGEEYLSFIKGELLHVRRNHEEGWALARHVNRDGDHEGWVPPAYLEAAESL